MLDDIQIMLFQQGTNFINYHNIGIVSVYLVLQLYVAIQPLAGEAANMPSEGAYSIFRLREDAQAVGGVITVSVNRASIDIPTYNGQLAVNVAEKIATLITMSEEFRSLNITAKANGTVVSFNRPGVYACSSSESALGIPPHPRAFTCHLNKTENSIHFSWDNPIRYDSIIIEDSTNIRFNRRSLNVADTKYIHHINEFDFVYKTNNVFGIVGMLNSIGCKNTCMIDF